MIYGGTKPNINRPEEEVRVSGFEYPTELFFSMLRITLVDDYDYEVKPVSYSKTKLVNILKLILVKRQTGKDS